MSIAALAAAATAEGDTEARIRAVFEAAADLFERDPRLGRILFRETFADDTLRRHGIGVIYAFTEVIVNQALTGTQAGLPQDPHDSELAVKAMAGALVALFLEWVEGRLEAPRDKLIDYCVNLTVNTLAMNAAPEPA